MPPKIIPSFPKGEWTGNIAIMNKVWYYYNCVIAKLNKFIFGRIVKFDRQNELDAVRFGV